MPPRNLSPSPDIQRPRDAPLASIAGAGKAACQALETQGITTVLELRSWLKPAFSSGEVDDAKLDTLTELTSHGTAALLADAVYGRDKTVISPHKGPSTVSKEESFHGPAHLRTFAELC